LGELVPPLPHEVKFADGAAADLFYASLKDYTNIAGLDECGRGPFAGPVVVSCVLLPPRHGIEGIKDSKKLSPRRRMELADAIMEVGVWGIGARTNEDIDRCNIREATFQAAADAVLQCVFSGAAIDYLLCDGGLFIADRIAVPTTAVVKGDLWFESIGAASIVAKVYRDNQMAIYHEVWPEYGFDTNQGYGTTFHREAIDKYGISPIHRRSYGMCKTAKERTNESQV